MRGLSSFEARKGSHLRTTMTYPPSAPCVFTYSA
jgi:hypothetical protein